MECLQLSVNKEVPKTILQCNNPSRRGNRQSFPRSLASFTFTDPDDLKIQPTSKRIVFPLTNRDFPALPVSPLQPFGEWLRLIDRKDQKILIGRCCVIAALLSLVASMRFLHRIYPSREEDAKRDGKKQPFHPGEIEFRLEVIPHLEFRLYNPFFHRRAEIEFAK